MSLKPQEVNFTETWGGLLETVQCVITCRCIQREMWNNRFSDVYRLCVANPEPLAEKLYSETKYFLENHVTKLHKEVAARNCDETLLAAYQKNWLKYYRGSMYLNELYRYLNNQVIRKQKFSEADCNYGGFIIEDSEKMLEIGELALDTWKRLMINPLKVVLVRIIIAEINKDRCQGNVNQNIVHGVINSFVEVEEYKSDPQLKILQFYIELFETAFLKDTGEFYRQQASKLRDENDCSDYLKEVIRKLDDENMRSCKFLHPSSCSKVNNEVAERMVQQHITYLHSACKHMVVNEKLDDLSHMYRILSLVKHGIDLLAQLVEEHVQKISSEVIIPLIHTKSDQIPANFVHSMLDVYRKYATMVNQTFQNDSVFSTALDKAIKTAVNFKEDRKNPCQSPVWLARYCDALLKKTAKGFSENEIDEKLTECMALFRYLDDKDYFQVNYKHMLARRLLRDLSISMDLEEGMINRLKQSCGFEFTTKLHQMFTDVRISNDLVSKFQGFVSGRGEDIGLNFSILVLQAGSWPVSASNLPTFNFPQELENSVNLFETFYKHQFSGRKLTWLWNHATAEVRITYLKKPYVVTMNVYQMAVLIALNSTETISFRELADITALKDSELAKHLHILIESQILLRNDPTAENFREDSVFTLNYSYTNKRTKFKIKQAEVKENVQESESMDKVMEDDRKHFLQAAIVKIMKSRKVLKHNALIQEVFNLSKKRFTPNVSLVKKCIEILIERAYLERTPNFADEYSYIA